MLNLIHPNEITEVAETEITTLMLLKNTSKYLISFIKVNNLN